MNLAGVAVVSSIGRISQSEIHLAVEETFHMLGTFDMGIVDHAVVSGAYAAQIAKKIENLTEKEIQTRDESMNRDERGTRIQMYGTCQWSVIYLYLTIPLPLHFIFRIM